MAIPRRNTSQKPLRPKEKLNQVAAEVDIDLIPPEQALGGDNEKAIGHTAEEVLFDAIITVLFVSKLVCSHTILSTVPAHGSKLFPLELQVHESEVEKKIA